MTNDKKPTTPGEPNMGQPKTDAPVTEFPMKFTWQTGDWEKLFDRNVELIKRELERARAEDRTIVYLSCPLSSRGGGHSRTNVEIAFHVARLLTAEWGDRHFFLNPAAYQLESREGTGLILQHIRDVFGVEPTAFLKKLLQYKPGGGDYMRMWTRVLVEDDYLRDLPGLDPKILKSGLNCGGMFDSYYFIGPSDVHRFFTDRGRSNVAAAIESYFTRKIEQDPDFATHFNYTLDNEKKNLRLYDLGDVADAGEWETKRKDFVRYYSIRAGAAYSLGSHDEWNIFVRLNAKRVTSGAYGFGEQIAGFFDGNQLPPSAAEVEISKGYESVKQQTVASGKHTSSVAWPRGVGR
jgi:hypothetical protein